MELTTLYDYLRVNARELGRRIVETYPPLHAPTDAPAPELSHLLRTPLPAQELAIMGSVKYLKEHDAVKIVGECGTGKTFMAGAGICFVAAHAKPFTTIVMCPPHLTEKWAREMIIAVPNARCYIIEDLRNPVKGKEPKSKPHGVVEIQYNAKTGLMKRHGLKTSLPKLREIGRKAWRKTHPYPCFFIVGREKAKLGYFWDHVYTTAGKHRRDVGAVLNIDTMQPVPKNENGFLTVEDFDDKRKHKEIIERGIGCDHEGKERAHGGAKLYSPMWAADRNKIQRMAPMDFMGRYMKDWFDYSIADEVHQLAGDTAQGNCLAVLARIAKKVITLTGTLLGGYASDCWGHLARVDAPLMIREGFEWGGAGIEAWQRKYGVIETVEKITEEDNSCSKNTKKTVQIIKKPGCSPMLFGTHLMNSTAFISLEDVADELPPYTEEVIEVEATGTLRKAYDDLAEQIKNVIKQYPKDKGLRSIMLQTLLCFPDHPFGFDTIYRRMFDKKSREYTVVKVAEPMNLSEKKLYPKEKALIQDIREELKEGRKCQVFAVYTGKHDVVGRLETILRDAGFRVAVLRPSVPTDKREAWYARRLAEGVDVVVCHPKLVETGLDLLSFPTLMFFETGYSTYTLRQASRRSWRIGQKHDVRVKFFSYTETMQSNCIRLMGRKVLVSMMMEGKFSGEGLAGIEEDTDLMSAMARELVEEGGAGETADAVWHQINQQRAVMFQPVQPVEQLVDATLPKPAIEPVIVEPEPIATDLATNPSLVLVEPEGLVPTVSSPFLPTLGFAPKKKKKKYVDPGQLDLFAFAA
jgi:superfamily II DNA or RNA helicase